MTKPIQDANASLTWLHDWTARLARAETDLGLTPGTLKLTGTPTVTGTGATAASVALNAAATGITFKLSTTLTPPVDLVLTVHVSLTNGDVDETTLTIGIV